MSTGIHSTALSQERLLPDLVRSMITEYLAPQTLLPPQLLTLSQRWHRLVVATKQKEFLQVPLMSAKEAQTCTGTICGYVMTSKRCHEMSDDELLRHGLDPWDDYNVTTLTPAREERANFEDPFATPYEQLLEPTLHIELDVASRRYFEAWQQKHGRAWPRQSDGRVHPLLLEAHKNIEDNHELKLEALLLQ